MVVKWAVLWANLRDRRLAELKVEQRDPLKVERSVDGKVGLWVVRSAVWSAVCLVVKMVRC